MKNELKRVENTLVYSETPTFMLNNGCFLFTFLLFTDQLFSYHPLFVLILVSRFVLHFFDLSLRCQSLSL